MHPCPTDLIAEWRDFQPKWKPSKGSVEKISTRSRPPLRSTELNVIGKELENFESLLSLGKWKGFHKKHQIAIVWVITWNSFRKSRFKQPKGLPNKMFRELGSIEVNET